MKLFLRMIFFSLLLFVMTACENKQQASEQTSDKADVRCVWCAMRPEKYPKWKTAVAEDGEKKLLTCSPRCLFFARESGKIDMETAYFFTEYYTQEWQSAETLFFVSESNVVGPMGVDFVPVKDSTAAVEFLKDHNGSEILRFTQINKQHLEKLK